MKKHTIIYLLFLYIITSLHITATGSEYIFETPCLNSLTQESIISIWESVFDTKTFTLHLELDTHYKKEVFLSAKIYLKNPENFLAGTVEIKFPYNNTFVELQWIHIHQEMRSKKIGSLCIEALKKTCSHLGYEGIALDAKFIDYSDTEDALIDDQKADALSYCKTLHFYARHNALRMPLILQKIKNTHYCINKNIGNCCMPLCIPLTQNAYTFIKEELHNATYTHKKHFKKSKSLVFPPKKALVPPAEMLIVQHTIKKLFKS